MQERLILKLSGKAADLIKEDPGNIQTYLLQELLENQEKIRLMVSGYFFLERKRIYDLSIDKASVMITTDGTGKFSTNFTIGILDGCADIDRNQSDKMTIDIAYDLNTGEVILTGEDIPEREPDNF